MAGRFTACSGFRGVSRSNSPALVRSWERVWRALAICGGGGGGEREEVICACDVFLGLGVVILECRLTDNVKTFNTLEEKSFYTQTTHLLVQYRWKKKEKSVDYFPEIHISIFSMYEAAMQHLTLHLKLKTKTHNLFAVYLTNTPVFLKQSRDRLTEYESQYPK